MLCFSFRASNFNEQEPMPRVKMQSLSGIKKKKETNKTGDATGLRKMKAVLTVNMISAASKQIEVSTLTTSFTNGAATNIDDAC